MPANTDRLGSLVEEIGGLGRVGARVGKVAAEEFGGGEIDEDQHRVGSVGSRRTWPVAAVRFVAARLFPSNPLDLVQWTAPDVAEAVDHRVVASLNRSVSCSTPCETSLAEADQPRSVALRLPTARYQLPPGDGFCLPEQKEQVHPPLARRP